jgi:hypothetical protein
MKIYKDMVDNLINDSTAHLNISDHNVHEMVCNGAIDTFYGWVAGTNRRFFGGYGVIDKNREPPIFRSILFKINHDGIEAIRERVEQGDFYSSRLFRGMLAEAEHHEPDSLDLSDYNAHEDAHA